MCTAEQAHRVPRQRLWARFSSGLRENFLTLLVDISRALHQFWSNRGAK